MKRSKDGLEEIDGSFDAALDWLDFRFVDC
jgi:hypothetical protein